MNYARARLSHPFAYSAVEFMADEMFVYIFDTFRNTYIELVPDSVRLRFVVRLLVLTIFSICVFGFGLCVFFLQKNVFSLSNTLLTTYELYQSVQTIERKLYSLRSTSDTDTVIVLYSLL